MRRMMLFVVFGLTLLGLRAQTILQPASAATLKPGQLVTISVMLNQSSGLSGAQFTISVPADLSALKEVAGPAGLAAGKQLVCGNLTGGLLTCLLFGVNTTVIPPGEIATITGTLSATPAGSETFALTGTLGADGMANAVPVGGGMPVVIPVQSKCDLNGDGVVNAVDVLALVNWVLGLSAPPAGVVVDLNADGKLDLYDVALLVNAALGGVCTAK